METRRLPNAVQITIRTDGAVSFGGDLSQFVDLDNGFKPKTVTSLRLRLLHARARLPSFVNIGAYPVDSAAVSLGMETLRSPFFNGDQGGPTDPRVDIDLRFYVPVTVQRFLLDGQYYGPNFREEDVLQPLDVDVTLGPDRSSIVITVISDRQDQTSAARLKRSPANQQNHRLTVAAQGTSGRLRVDALHSPLDDVVHAVSVAAGLPLTVDDAASGTDVSLLLPDATTDQVLDALASGYGLTLVPRPAEDGGGYALARGGAAFVTERLRLNNLAPDQARLLFPDFLLPYLHTDIENNALIAAGPPALVARLRQDLALLDRPRPQVRVEVTVWEVASNQDAQNALSVTRTLGQDSETVDTDASTISIKLSAGQQRQFTAALTALATKGRARLAARPYVIVASGTSGSLFLGQDRFITVIQQSNGRQDTQVVRLPIGTTLTVAPTVGGADDVTLDLHPRVSTVDEIEGGTGLPTLGIREADTLVRLGPQDAALIAGLDMTSESQDTRRLSPAAHLPLLRDLFAAHRRGHSQTAFFLLVTAHRIG